MKQFMDGSQVIAETVRRCRPQVATAYPITPQTHIVEGLAKMIADGQLEAQMANVESEQSAASVVLGASATGARTYTATSSQGLLLMSEVLYNIAGLRLPVVLTCANRSVSAPLNIWNDHQDSMTLRDAGILQFYAENGQEAIELHLLAYRMAEDARVLLPAMVCIDGYRMTHASEVVDMPDQELVDKWLPPFKPKWVLDVENPQSLGVFFEPSGYMETRYAIQKTLEEVVDLFPEFLDNFEQVFGHQPTFPLERYHTDDAEQILVGMGTMAGGMKDVVDELRAKGQKVGLLKVVCFRPFPSKEVYEACKHAREIAVFEKDVSLGAASAPLASEFRSAFYRQEEQPKISGFVVGLGGRDVPANVVKEALDKVTGKQTENLFMDLRL